MTYPYNCCARKNTVDGVFESRESSPRGASDNFVKQWHRSSDEGRCSSCSSFFRRLRPVRRICVVTQKGKG